MINDEKNIIIVYADRAELSILEPICNELKNKNKNFQHLNLSEHITNIHDDKNLSKIYDFTYDFIENNKIDFVILIGDRREVMFASLAFFVKQIPIIQLASGDLSSEISLVDDFYRHLLTIISSKQISFSKTSLNKTNDILTTLNIKPNSIFYPNPTLDRLNLKNLINKIDEKYDLILMHPQSLSFKDTIDDKNKLLELINFNKKNIIIRGNKDKNYEIYYDLWNNLSAYENIEVYDNLEKQKFISLLKFANRFITNSSCSFYEAPLFLNNDQIIRIGRRNKNREIVKYNKDELNSAKKIVDFILK